MSGHSDNLEREIDDGVASLSADLAVELPEALIRRVKAAVRHELNEAWLADQPAPVPPPEVLRRVRVAVGEELRRLAGEDRPSSPAAKHADTELAGLRGRRAVWLRMLPPVATAAMIGICIGVIHYVGSLKPAPPRDQPAGGAMVERFVEAAEQTYAEDPWTTSMLAGLDAIEESITEWQPVRDYSTELLEELVSEIDELLADSEPDHSVSEGSTALPGVFV